jgi:ferredoxin
VHCRGEVATHASSHRSTESATAARASRDTAVRTRVHAERTAARVASDQSDAPHMPWYSFDMPKLAIAGTSRVLDAPAGTSLLDIIQGGGHPIATSCGGVATCALCRITIREGKEHLTPINSSEINHLGSVAKIIGLRLACQAKLTGDGDVTVEVPPVEDIAAKKQAKADRLRALRASGGGGRR